MTMNPLAAIFQRLDSNPDVTDCIGFWKGDPAIISVSPVPEDVDGPFITLSEEDGEFTNFQGMVGLRQPITIGCFSDNEESLKDMKDLAMLVFTDLHEGRFEEGNEFGVVASYCTWPVRGQSDNGYQGYTMTCTVQAYEEKEI